ncbi:MAG: DMT family transporter [Sphingobacteriales bacterium]|nr:DMT family transporter [Sphingobacteriales bacterium]
MAKALTKMNEQTKGIIAIVCANIIFGMNIPVTKALVSGWVTPMAYTLIRMFFGAIVFWIIGFSGKNEKIQTKDYFILALGGFLGFLSTQYTFALALQYTTPVNYALLMALTPVIVLVLSAFFLKEKIGWKKLLGILLSVSGAILIVAYGKSGGQGKNDLLGILIALLCSVCYGIYILLTRSVSIKYSPITVVKWMFLFALIFSFPFGINGIAEQKIFSSQIALSGIFLMAFSLIFSTLIAFFFMPVALGRLKASTVSIFMNLQPVVASIIAIIVGQDFLLGIN